MKEFLPKSAAKMADCLMKRYGLLTSRWSYDYGVAWRGMEALYAMTGEKKYFDYIKDAMDTFVTDESGAIRDYTQDEFNLDYICNGRQLPYLYKATGDKKYLRAADAAIRAGGEPDWRFSRMAGAHDVILWRLGVGG